MIKVFIAVIIMMSIPFAGSAQGPSLDSLPAPVTDLFNTFEKIKIDIGGGTLLPRVAGSIKNISLTPGDILSYVKGVWDSVNSWFENKIGISFREIIRTVANFFVWALELIIKVIRAGISLV